MVFSDVVVALDAGGCTDVFLSFRSSVLAACGILEEAFRSRRGNGKKGAEAEAGRALAWAGWFSFVG